MNVRARWFVAALAGFARGPIAAYRFATVRMGRAVRVVDPVGTEINREPERGETGP